ncbi:MAG: hypothetical protein GEV11_05525 [Streptosporangiales bacterium]|nr:hypothetical protein [Streptosporangiales bacterium]
MGSLLLHRERAGVKQGPFPVDGLIPLLKPLADYGWAIGLFAALLLCTGLMWPSRTRTAPP